MLKHVGVHTYHELYFLICILLSAFVGYYIEYKKMHCMNNIKFVYVLYTSVIIFEYGHFHSASMFSNELSSWKMHIHRKPYIICIQYMAVFGYHDTLGAQ